MKKIIFAALLLSVGIIFPSYVNAQTLIEAIEAGDNQTVCTLLENGAGALPQTESFAKAFGARDSLGLVQTLVPLEKWKRDALAELLQNWLELLEMAMVCRSGVQTPSGLARELASTRSSRELHDAAMHLKKALDYCLSNVSPAAVCGYLQWVLRE